MKKIQNVSILEEFGGKNLCILEQLSIYDPKIPPKFMVWQPCFQQPHTELPVNPVFGYTGGN